MTDLPNLGLPFFQPEQNDLDLAYNDAMVALDTLVMLSVIDRDHSTPPGSPEEGDRYLVKATGSGAFAGWNDYVVVYSEGQWMQFPPRVGWTCYVQDEAALLAWDGDAWQPALDVLGGVTELQELTLLGVGTTADATNPVSAKLNNALWAAKTIAEGGDGHLRYKLSKESAAKTLSFLFQDNFSGRAEIGLTGDDDFHFKVSPDGSSWIDALVLDKSTGAAKLNAGLQLAGDISPSQITSDQDDYNPAGLAGASVLRLSTDASRNLTGLAGGADGRVAAIVNAGSNAIVLKDASTSSSAANRFAFGADVTLTAKQSAVLWYDATDSRWKLIAGPQAASGGGSVPADLDILLAELALGLADALNVAQFLGSAGNRFADSFDALTYVDTGGATNLDSGTVGLLKPTGSAGSTSYANSGGTGDRTGSVTVTTSFTWDDGISSNLVDGATGNSNADAVDEPGAGSTAITDGGYIQFDFGSGKYIDEVKVIHGSSTTHGVWKFRGSNDGSSFTDLATSLDWNTGGTSQTFTIPAYGQTYRYFRWEKQGTGTNWPNTWLKEFEFKIASSAPGTNNLTVASTTLTAAAAPASAKLVSRAKFVDSITLGTDLFFDVSRDGGSTFTTFTVNDRFTANSIHVLESASLDISGQPSGTSMKWRARSANNKMVELHDIYLYWS